MIEETAPVHVEAATSDTIHAVKLKVQCQVGTPPGQQAMTFAGRPVADTDVVPSDAFREGFGIGSLELRCQSSPSAAAAAPRPTQLPKQDLPSVAAAILLPTALTKEAMKCETFMAQELRTETVLVDGSKFRDDGKIAR